MKKKRKTAPVILCAVLICLVISLASLNHYNAKEEEEKAASESAAEADVAVLIPAEEEQISGIRVKNSYGDYSFVKKDDQWIYEDAEDFPLEQSRLTEMVSLAAGLGAKREVADSLDSAAEYGLDEPAYTFTVTDTDGQSITLYIGDENSQASVYYAYLEGDTTVYAITEDLVAAGDYELYDLIDAVEFPDMAASDIRQVKLTRVDGSWSCLTREQAVSEETEAQTAESEEETGETETAASEDEEILTYTDSQGREKETETDTSESWLGTVAGISYEDCVNYKAEGEGLAEYGLNTPTKLEITYTDEEEQEQTVTLKLGGTDEDGNYYLQQSGSSQVLKLDSVTAEAILQMQETVLAETETAEETE